MPEAHIAQLCALMEAVVDCARFPADALLHEANGVGQSFSLLKDYLGIYKQAMTLLNIRQPWHLQA